MALGWHDHSPTESQMRLCRARPLPPPSSLLVRTPTTRRSRGSEIDLLLATLLPNRNFVGATRCENRTSTF